MAYLAVGSCLIAYMALVVIPRQREIGKLRTLATEKQLSVKEAAIRIQGTESLAARCHEAKQVVSQWRMAAPGESQINSLYATLAALAQTSTVNIERLLPKDSTTTSVLRLHPLEIEVVGDYSALMDFVQRVESLPHTIWVDRVNLQSDSNRASSVRCVLSLTVFANNSEISG